MPARRGGITVMGQQISFRRADKRGDLQIADYLLLPVMSLACILLLLDHNYRYSLASASSGSISPALEMPVRLC